MTDVMVPALGESVSEATVSTWFKKPGDAVKQDEMLCELETDKVSVEVPSPVAGVLAEILAPEGTTVAANARLAIVTEGAAADRRDPPRPGHPHPPHDRRGGLARAPRPGPQRQHRRDPRRGRSLPPRLPRQRRPGLVPPHRRPPGP